MPPEALIPAGGCALQRVSACPHPFDDRRIDYTVPAGLIAVDGATIHVLYRQQGTSSAWQTATVQEETASAVAIIGLQSGETCDFRLQYWRPNHFASPVTAINATYVIGRVGPPEDLQNLSLVSIGGSALLRWDLAADLDVQFGGWIMFRHTPEMNATLWPNSTSLARAVTGDQTHVRLPLKPGTNFARVFDADGRPSLRVAAVSTRQASLLDFSPIGEVAEDPLFAGTRTRCRLVGGGLVLDAEDVDAVPDVDAETSWDVSGGVAASGRCQFAAGIDLGSVRPARITSDLMLEAINEGDFWDAKIGEIDSWPDIDGTLGASVDAALYGKLTDDDPAGNPTWGPFTRIDSAEINARAIGQLECRLSTADQGPHQGLLSAAVGRADRCRRARYAGAGGRTGPGDRSHPAADAARPAEGEPAGAAQLSPPQSAPAARGHRGEHGGAGPIARTVALPEGHDAFNLWLTQLRVKAETAT